MSYLERMDAKYGRIRENRIGKHQRPGAASSTQIDAAKRIAPVTGKSRKRVFDYLRGCGNIGATDDEMQVSLSMNPSTQRPRRVELVESGHVVDSDTRRSTRSGSMAVVWVTT